jgi:hypothetical protein
MDSSLRLAWTQIVTGEDHDEHMAAVGQAQAAAALTAEMIRDAGLRAGGRLVISGAGTGQMFDFLNPALFRPFELTCTDLNPTFLARLRERLVRQDLSALILADDIEHTALVEGPDFLLAVLLLEQIDWRKGVEVIAAASGLRNRHPGEPGRHDVRGNPRTAYSGFAGGSPDSAAEARAVRRITERVRDPRIPLRTHLRSRSRRRETAHLNAVELLPRRRAAQAETIKNAVVSSDIDAAIGHRKPGEVIKRFDLVSTRIELFAGQCVERVESGMRRVCNSQRTEIGEPFVWVGLIRIFAAAIRIDDSIGDHRRLGTIHIARHPNWI